MRERITGSATIPRISVYRSNRYIYVQAIDDMKRQTLAAASSFSVKTKKVDAKIKKSDEASVVGKHLAELLVKKGVKRGVFDRGRYAYLGRVKALAEGLRQGGLTI